MGYGQQVGGTHPTGMHSCTISNGFVLLYCLLNIISLFLGEDKLRKSVEH